MEVTPELRASGFGELVSQSFSIAFGRFFKLLTIYLMFLVPVGAAGALLRFEASAADVALYGFVSFVTVFLWVFPRGAGLIAVSDAFTGETTTIRCCYRAAFAYPGPLFLLSLAVNLMIGLGLVMLVIPGLILLAYFGLAVEPAVAERLTVGKALGRSHELTSGHRFTFLFFLLVLALAWGIPCWLVSAGAGVLLGETSFLAVLIEQLTDVLFFLGLAVGTSRFYLHLRALKDGLTADQLGEIVEALTAPPEPLESTPSP